MVGAQDGIALENRIGVDRGNRRRAEVAGAKGGDVHAGRGGGPFIEAVVGDDGALRGAVVSLQNGDRCAEALVIQLFQGAVDGQVSGVEGDAAGDGEAGLLAAGEVGGMMSHQAGDL